MGDFEKILPVDLLQSVIRTLAGSELELVFPFAETRRAILVATTHQIAVLGVEVFRILPDGLGVINYSGYGFDDKSDDWTLYVTLNNDAAAQFVSENERGPGYGYILTASSRTEAATLRSQG